MEFIDAKTIVRPVKPTDQYISNEYNMNIYRGCSHGCIYCDSRSECYQLQDFDTVKAKRDALTIIENELKRKRKKGIIGTGAMSDPYNPMEEKYELTRGALKLIDKYGFGISITTKSPLIVRDIDILKSISKHSPVDIHITITANDDELSKKIEPSVAPSSERFKAIYSLSQNNLFTGIFINPILPFITDTIENITGIVKRGAEAHAKNIICFTGVTIRNGSRDYLYKSFDKIFPNMREKYTKNFGINYMCNSPDSSILWRAFKNECNKYDIIYDFKTLNKTIRSLYPKEASLFD